MSGVGGYELNWTDQSIWARFLGSRFNGAIEPHKLTVTSALGSYNIMETKVPSYAKKFKVRIDGIVDETVAYKYINASGTLVRFDIFDSVPTKETDGFTEQDLINYVLENLITK